MSHRRLLFRGASRGLLNCAAKQQVFEKPLKPTRVTCCGQRRQKRLQRPHLHLELLETLQTVGVKGFGFVHEAPGHLDYEQRGSVKPPDQPDNPVGSALYTASARLCIASICLLLAIQTTVPGLRIPETQKRTYVILDTYIYSNGSVDRPINQSKTIYLYMCPSVCCLSDDVSMRLSICLPTYLPKYLRTCLSMYLSIYLSIYLSTYPPVSPCTCLPIHLPSPAHTHPPTPTHPPTHPPNYPPTCLHSVYLPSYLSTRMYLSLPVYVFCLSLYLSIFRDR